MAIVSGLIKNVANSSNDILTPAYQAVECSFRGIIPTTNEWTEEDDDKYWDLVSLCNQSGFEKIRTRITPNTDTFHAVQYRTA